MQIEVKMNKEIMEYREAMFFGLDFRQMACSLLAVLAAVGIYFSLRDVAGEEVTGWLCMLGAAPFAFCGFFRYHGMTAEQFALAFIKSEFLYPKRLLFQPEDLYYQCMEESILAGERRKKKAERKKEKRDRKKVREGKRISRKDVKKKQLKKKRKSQNRMELGCGRRNMEPRRFENSRKNRQNGRDGRMQKGDSSGQRILSKEMPGGIQPNPRRESPNGIQQERRKSRPGGAQQDLRKNPQRSKTGSMDQNPPKNRPIHIHRQSSQQNGRLDGRQENRQTGNPGRQRKRRDAYD